ncbi:MAG: SDR family oxidoreductase [Phycisphaerales bacterium]
MSPDRAERPVALITGAAKRVGRATALAFVDAGCDLVITYRTSEDEAQELRDEASARAATVRLEHLDLNDLDATSALGERLAKDLPRLDVLVHNASIYGPTPLESLAAADALRHYRVNALAPLLLTRDLAPLLRESPLPGGGAVVAMADIHAMGRPRKQFSAYAMSKAALVEMVRTLARELAPRIRVNAVAPGVVAFPDEGYESSESEQAAYLSRVPLERTGTPEDAAAAVRWLALEARYVTGEVVRVDGGRWLG